MSKHRVEATIPHPVDAVAEACQEAVAQLGWRILDQSPAHIVCKEAGLADLLKGTWPAEIEVKWRKENAQTHIELNGRITGFGPIQSNHLKGQMGNLQNRIQLCLRKVSAPQQRTPSPAPAESTLTSELENLARLRSQGILSDNEFASAKAKLLGQPPPATHQSVVAPVKPPPPASTDISFNCPHCDQHCEADASIRGQRVACPSCNQEFVVP